MYIDLVLTPFLPVTEMIPFLLVVLLSLLRSSVASVSAELHPPYTLHGATYTQQSPTGVQTNARIHGINFKTLSHSQTTLDQLPTDSLQVRWVNSTVHTISISWTLVEEYNVTGFLHHSVVEYFPAGGRFTSHPLPHDVRNYTLVNLNSGTVYTICVNMKEIIGAHNETSRYHSKCVKINTIEYIRRDSVVIMLITLGYYAFMALIGYAQWRKRLYSIASRAKNRSRTDTNSQTSAHMNATMRWKDLAEKEKLIASKPNCSIECMDT